MPKGDPIRVSDGQFDWSGGVNSAKVKTIASQSYPKGLPRNQLTWLNNATVRGGGILQRTGWQPLVKGAGLVDLFQGAFMYEPDFADPYIVMSIGGRIYRCRVDTDNSVEDLSATFGFTNPPNITEAFMEQSEMFLVIQAGDFELGAAATDPLFFSDFAGSTSMRRSNGFVAAGDPNNEIPPAGPMNYSQQRLWYAFGRAYAAGDIVLNKTSGTLPFLFRDSVLHVTENPVAKGGDAFIVPTNAGNIRGLKHCSNLDTALGESSLFVFTRRSIYACEAPITRDDWAGATLAKMPLQKVALQKGGTYSHRSIVPVNGDLYFNSIPNGDIRSLQQSIRYFNQPGNVPISRNENRILRFNDRALMRYASGIEFDNRLWQLTAPIETPVGVAFKSVMPLDFDVVSSMQEQEPPAWEGSYEGLLHLQILVGDFGGRERAFSIAYSPTDHEIQIWELTIDNRFEDGEKRVQWVIETPAYTFDSLFQLKELETMELWLDKLLGRVNIEVQWFVDQHPCPFFWHRFDECAAKDCSDDPNVECVYDTKTPYCEQFRATLTLPKPPVYCIQGRKYPAHVGYQFQVRLIIKGWMRLRGLLLHGLMKEKGPFEGIKC